MINETDTDERLARLDKEWRRKYEALENTMHVAINLLCDAIAVGKPDAQMINRMGHGRPESRAST